MIESRIRKRIEQKSRRTLFLSVVGSIIVLLFLFFYGVPLLTNFAIFIGKGKTANTTSNDTITYISAPVLNPTFVATNSATITISGNAIKNQTIKLYVDGSFSGNQTADNNGSFTFDNVTLTPGINDIKATALDSNAKESDYSNILSVNYINKGPTLTVSSPSDNQAVSGGNNKMFQVKGTTSTDSKVTVNNFWAITDDLGNYTYTLQLQNGDNNITIVATDPAGNTTTVQKKITYNP